MTDIKQLLNKYETVYGENRRVHGEQTSNTYHNQQRQSATVKNRHLILDELLNETDHPINKQQRTEIKTWIDQFQEDWKTIHRQSSDETIILALIIIQYRKNNYKIPLTITNAINKYKLTTQKFILIQNRVIFLLMKNTPLKYTLQDKYRQYQKEISQ